jgi:RNA polymerase sigma-70 factor (ECF subfamily)
MPKRAEQPGDDAVVAQVLEGRTDAFETLVLRYEGYVFGLVKKHVPPADVEDTAQEAFIRAYKSLSTYRGRGGGFKSWLASITVRTCYDYWRRAYRSKERPVSYLTENSEKWLESVLAESSVTALEERGAADEARELLEAGLARLSAEDRMVLDLVYLEEHSGKEAAELLGWSTANVKVRCFRARRKLEAFLLKAKRSERT